MSNNYIPNTIFTMAETTGAPASDTGTGGVLTNTNSVAGPWRPARQCQSGLIQTGDSDTKNVRDWFMADNWPYANNTQYAWYVTTWLCHTMRVMPASNIQWVIFEASSALNDGFRLYLTSQSPSYSIKCEYSNNLYTPGHMISTIQNNSLVADLAPTGPDPLTTILKPFIWHKITLFGISTYSASSNQILVRVTIDGVYPDPAMNRAIGFGATNNASYDHTNFFLGTNRFGTMVWPTAIFGGFAYGHGSDDSVLADPRSLATRSGIPQVSAFGEQTKHFDPPATNIVSPQYRYNQPIIRPRFGKFSGGMT
jgi:hypothetical protein